MTVLNSERKQFFVIYVYPENGIKVYFLLYKEDWFPSQRKPIISVIYVYEGVIEKSDIKNYMLANDLLLILSYSIRIYIVMKILKSIKYLSTCTILVFK